MEDDASRARAYRAKAEELQRLALQMSSKAAQKSFIKMADDYLLMARRLDPPATMESD